MHLGINAIRLCRSFTGVGRYLECLLAEWGKAEQPFRRITLFTHSPLDQARVAFPLDRFEQRVVGLRLPDPIWESSVLPSATRDVDVFFGPSYTLPLGGIGKCVVTNHGPAENQPLTYQWFRANVYEALYFASAHRANRVLAASSSVQQRLIRTYRIPAAKITVTYPAASERFQPIDDLAARAQACQRHGIPPGPFALFVGKMAHRHYIPTLIEAFAAAKVSGALPHRLVLIGPNYLNLDIVGLARRAGIEAHVMHVPYATHETLPAIYSAADFFVFPASEAEGFGIPVVEAMACGTPVVTTALGSLREVAVGAALTTSAPSVDELTSAMLRVAADEALRRELIQKGRERARQFTWPVTAKKTMDALWQVARS